MRLLLVLVAAAAVVAPSEQVANPPFLFHHTPGANFVYGYGFPQYQAQRSASVPGTLTYLNTYGQPSIPSHLPFSPEINVQNPLVPVVGQRSEPVNVPVAPLLQYTSESKQDSARSSLSPLLKLAVNAGFVQASGSSQTGSPQYEVSPALAEDAGSVSELATRLGAIPVAAVHDVQMRPNTIASDQSFSPVLIHKEMPKVTLYTLEVPIQ